MISVPVFLTLLFLRDAVSYQHVFRHFPSYKLAMSSSQEEKKLPKVEGIKQRSGYLFHPLQEELGNDEIFISHDAVVVMKYHGSYMQDNREKRQKGAEKDYQFMLRLKSPAGEVPPELYLKLDELADQFGQGDLRITTRQAFQLHGILKGNLKLVISTIMEAGSSTVGACGDVSRNVMCSPAPFTSPAYKAARDYSKVMAELFKPQSSAFTELWLTGADGEKEKVVEMEYWLKDLQRSGFDVEQIRKDMRTERGSGTITTDAVEPIYGQRYLPRKFKIAVTVPGDNSLDLLTNDIGLVAITDDASGDLLGFNVFVGGGMGRTHLKETTFPRTADPLGFVEKDEVNNLCKAIIAAQRDHGNREVRPNARMKYLVHNLGIDKFRELVEGYYGKPVAASKATIPWKYSDFMGWHEQGDGHLFLGINVEQGRVKDYSAPLASTEKAPQVKSALKAIVQQFNLTMILSPTQSVFFKDILPEQRPIIDQILRDHNISPVEEIDPLVRLSIACPALPLCGLALTEAERRMPDWAVSVRKLLTKLQMDDDKLMLRMTGCPNGCARPYMAELALVGDGPEMYQIWLGGSPDLTRLAFVYRNKVKWADMDSALEPLLAYWKQQRSHSDEAFGDFCTRIGSQGLLDFAAAYKQ